MVSRVKLLGAQMVHKAGFHNQSGKMSLQSQNSIQQVAQRSLTFTIIRPI